MNDHEVLDEVEDDLEEVEPEAWTLDQVDEEVEGFRGYSEFEAEVNEDDSDDSVGDESDQPGEADPV